VASKKYDGVGGSRKATQGLLRKYYTSLDRVGFLRIWANGGRRITASSRSTRTSWTRYCIRCSAFHWNFSDYEYKPGESHAGDLPEIIHELAETPLSPSRRGEQIPTRQRRPYPSLSGTTRMGDYAGTPPDRPLPHAHEVKNSVRRGLAVRSCRMATIPSAHVVDSGAVRCARGENIAQAANQG